MIMAMEMETIREVAKAEIARRSISLSGPRGRMPMFSESLTETAANVMRVSTTCRMPMSSCYR